MLGDERSRRDGVERLPRPDEEARGRDHPGGERGRPHRECHALDRRAQDQAAPAAPAVGEPTGRQREQRHAEGVEGDRAAHEGFPEPAGGEIEIEEHRAEAVGRPAQRGREQEPARRRREPSGGLEVVVERAPERVHRILGPVRERHAIEPKANGGLREARAAAASLPGSLQDRDAAPAAA